MKQPEDQSPLRFPFYPLLVAGYTVLFLWSNNLGQVIPAVTLRAFALVLFAGLVLHLFWSSVSRSWHKGALISAWLLFFILMYGHLYALVDGWTIGGVSVTRHRFLLPLLGLATLWVVTMVLRARRDFASLTRVLNLVFLALIAFAAVPAAAYEVRYASISEFDHMGNALTTADAKADIKARAEPVKPDIYFLVLDGYTSADVLQSEFGFDNGPFLDRLRALGFYLPECASSNYFKTIPSLASTMNLEYLETMGIQGRALVSSFDPVMSQTILRSRLRKELESRGYRTVAFRGHLQAIDLTDAYYYFNLHRRDEKTDQIARHNFEQLLLRTTILAPLVEAYEGNKAALDFLPDAVRSLLDRQVSDYHITETEYYTERQYAFDVLSRIPDLPGQKFVYGHLYGTHTPFVFDASGAYTPVETHHQMSGYVPAVQYTNKRVLESIEIMLRQSPIIILQGDHGAFDDQGVLNNRILSAYYFPDGDYSRLYNTITPVNTFRVVLNQFFQGDYPLLKDTLLVQDGPYDEEGVVRRLPASCPGN